MRALLLAALCATVACAQPASYAGRSTAQLTTPGIVALHEGEVVKLLDVVRDAAVSADASKIISTATATTIVTWHRAALLAIRETPNGWKPTVLSGLTQTLAALTPAERAILGPYFDAAALVIKVVI